MDTFGIAPLRLSEAGAFPTNAGARSREVGVCFIERVPVDAVGLSCVPRADPDPSKQVDPSGDRLHMGWVLARSVPAEMIDVKTNGDWPDQEFIRDPVGALHARAAPATTDLPVPETLGSEPRPALIWTAAIDFGPIALGEWRSLARHEEIIAMSDCRYNAAAL
jgi:hypothetical protein